MQVGGGGSRDLDSGARHCQSLLALNHLFFQSSTLNQIQLLNKNRSQSKIQRSISVSAVSLQDEGDGRGCGSF